jgi:hypothetical protein
MCHVTKKPNGMEIRPCKASLEVEINLIQPEIIVFLSAARSVDGSPLGTPALAWI